MKTNIKKLVVILFTIIVAVVMASIMAGCGNEKEVVAVNVESKTNTINNNILGKSAMIEIGNYLWYDSTTGIVYWWDGRMHLNQFSSTTPTPYYSSNGLLYRYIPETNTLEEVKHGE